MKKISVAQFRRIFPVGTMVASIGPVNNISNAEIIAENYIPLSYPRKILSMTQHQMSISRESDGKASYLQLKGHEAFEVKPGIFMLTNYGDGYEIALIYAKEGF